MQFEIYAPYAMALLLLVEEGNVESDSKSEPDYYIIILLTISGNPTTSWVA